MVSKVYVHDAVPVSISLPKKPQLPSLTLLPPYLLQQYQYLRGRVLLLPSLNNPLMQLRSSQPRTQILLPSFIPPYHIPFALLDLADFGAVFAFTLLYL